MAPGVISTHLILVCLAGMSSSAPLGVEKNDQLRSKIAKLIEFYNNQSSTDFLFKLLKVGDGTISDQQDGSTDAQTVSFVLQETDCFKLQEHTNPDNCVFKADGEVKQCSVSISAGEQELRCESPSALMHVQTKQWDQYSEALSKRLKSAECLECIFSQVPK
ncbi:cathelicidin antimicrobial peptide-like [Xenopus laevis]|uniref:Cathelicidin antimicrobial peptide-like n=2 Tax=Xenopus laevis TaxID=8355 RepID=A0A1L8FUX3_XENLA|nr:cathelicidin antimicrobial peptide-like [Xenopus laevis]OCT75378.1 hypothetical protein XELAEV_18030557mg [Xenopus laevis]